MASTAYFTNEISRSKKKIFVSTITECTSYYGSSACSYYESLPSLA